MVEPSRLGMQPPQAQCCWRDLLPRYLRVITDKSPDSSAIWVEAWRVIVEHPWYQMELEGAARRLLCTRGALDWLGDVQHDAMLLLARSLQSDPDLGLDPQRIDEHFGGWMGVMIRNDCRQAFRRIHRLFAPSRELFDTHVTADERSRIEDRIDVSRAVDQLAEPGRSILTPHAHGFSVQEISSMLELEYFVAYRAYRRGVEEMRARGLPLRSFRGTYAS